MIHIRTCLIHYAIFIFTEATYVINLTTYMIHLTTYVIHNVNYMAFLVILGQKGGIWGYKTKKPNRASGWALEGRHCEGGFATEAISHDWKRGLLINSIHFKYKAEFVNSALLHLLRRASQWRTGEWRAAVGLAIVVEILFAVGAEKPPRPKRAPLLEKRRGIKYTQQKRL